MLRTVINRCKIGACQNSLIYLGSASGALLRWITSAQASEPTGAVCAIAVLSTVLKRTICEEENLALADALEQSWRQKEIQLTIALGLSFIVLGHP